jgi:hypothetical protein
MSEMDIEAKIKEYTKLIKEESLLRSLIGNRHKPTITKDNIDIIELLFCIKNGLFELVEARAAWSFSDDPLNDDTLLRDGIPLELVSQFFIDAELKIKNALVGGVVSEPKRKAIYNLIDVVSQEINTIQDNHSEPFLILINMICEIICFKSDKILDELNSYYSYTQENRNTDFYLNLIRLFYELKAFADSGISEKKYLGEIKVYKKWDIRLQFLDEERKLSLLPKSPSTAFFDVFYRGRVFYRSNKSEFVRSDCILPILNFIRSHLGLKELKTLPHPPKEVKDSNQIRDLFKNPSMTITKEDIEKFDVDEITALYLLKLIKDEADNS